MLLQLFSIFDKKTRIYHPPIYAHNAGHAMRVLTDVFTRSNSVYLNYPDDFEVYEVGQFNDQKCLIKTIEPARLLCTARDLMTKEQINAEKLALLRNNNQSQEQKQEKEENHA